MVKTANIDVEKLNEAIRSSGLRVGFIADTLGISRQGFDKKRKGQISFRLSEVYVLCDLLRLTNVQKTDIFFPSVLG